MNQQFGRTHFIRGGGGKPNHFKFSFERSFFGLHHPQRLYEWPNLRAALLFRQLGAPQQQTMKVPQEPLCRIMAAAVRAHKQSCYSELSYSYAKPPAPLVLSCVRTGLADSCCNLTIQPKGISSSNCL